MRRRIRGTNEPNLFKTLRIRFGFSCENPSSYLCILKKNFSSPSRFSCGWEIKNRFSTWFSPKMRTVGSQCENRAENWVTRWKPPNTSFELLASDLLGLFLSLLASKFVFICANKTKHSKLGVLHRAHGNFVLGFVLLIDSVVHFTQSQLKLLQTYCRSIFL